MLWVCMGVTGSCVKVAVGVGVGVNGIRAYGRGYTDVRKEFNTGREVQEVILRQVIRAIVYR